MTLNIYVGALTFYWEWQWKYGPPYQFPQIEGGPVVTVWIDRKRKAEELQERRTDIVVWRERLSKKLGSKIPAPLDWDETNTTYAVATPHHAGLRALRLWAAYADHPDLQLPARSLKLKDDPAYLRSTTPQANARFLQIIPRIVYWLPSPFDFVFKGKGPDGGSASFGSAPTLLRQLQDLNDTSWKATQGMIEEWEAAGLPSEGSIEQKARYGFSQAFLAAQYACNNTMPMKLDQ